MEATLPPPINGCFKCKHYGGTYVFDPKPIPGLPGEHLNYCDAFPKGTIDGIPHAILVGEHDHTKPYPGDNGIQFEKAEDT